MGYGVVNLNVNDALFDENEGKSKRKKAKIPVWYWEIWLTRDDEPMLVGPFTRHEMFYWLETQGYEIPEKIKRLKPLDEYGR